MMCMKGIWQIIDKLIRKASPHVPFYLENTILRSVGRERQSILDGGCGWGAPMESIPHKHDYTVGADIFRPYLKEAKGNKTHEDFVLMDVRKLPFKENSFDIALCMEVIEYLEKDDGMRLIEKMEKIARRLVIVTTPVGFWQDPGKDGNPYQVHRSGFYPIGFKKLGYLVRGFGSRVNPLSFSYSYLRIFRWILLLIFSPISYYFPNFGERMICIKRLNDFSHKKRGK